MRVDHKCSYCKKVVWTEDTGADFADTSHIIQCQECAIKRKESKSSLHPNQGLISASKDALSFLKAWHKRFKGDNDYKRTASWLEREIEKAERNCVIGPDHEGHVVVNDLELNRKKPQERF